MLAVLAAMPEDGEHARKKAYRTLLSAVVACRAPLFKAFVVSIFDHDAQKAEDVVAKASLVLNVAAETGAVLHRPEPDQRRERSRGRGIQVLLQGMQRVWACSEVLLSRD